MGVYLLTLPLPRVTGGYCYSYDDDDESGLGRVVSNNHGRRDGGGVGC